MTTFLKILLTASVALFLASLTETGSGLAWGFLKPLSAILFIVFFIGQLLHKEVVKYDEECRSRLGLAKAVSTSTPAAKPTTWSPEKTHNQVPLGTAH